MAFKGINEGFERVVVNAGYGHLGSEDMIATLASNNCELEFSIN